AVLEGPRLLGCVKALALVRHDCSLAMEWAGERRLPHPASAHVLHVLLRNTRSPRDGLRTCRLPLDARYPKPIRPRSTAPRTPAPCPRSPATSPTPPAPRL